eukprot:TRINITY_DN168_c0_g1_i5.p1 TRINITY_DN168_c0_g1~~TRINITY_DN168_c0_g1_i5.p1  ORF type:complete len:489 (+),score=-0.04 TRINITY_DN168_c0_g1_i5:203-1468(+)
MLVDNLTVSQNIVLGEEVTKAGFILDSNEEKAKIKEIIKKYGLHVDPDAKIEDISVGMQQRVEILKALYRGVDILILDEPTAVLTPQEIEELSVIMNNLTKLGKTVIIITHKLKEILNSADFCTIIRRGKYIDTVEVKNTTEIDLAKMMVGHDVNLVVNKEKASPKDVVFEIKNLTVEDERGIEQIKDLNLKIRKGEIYGIAGIDGNGQKELIEAITCLINSKEGKIVVNGNEVQNTSTLNVMESGISTIHEDRQRRGLVLDFTVNENMVLETYRKKPYSNRGVLQFNKIRKFAKEKIKEYDIRPEDCADKKVRELSGGNQQKVIIAREVENNPHLLIAVQPTRGLDVGAIEYIHKTLIRERDKGKAILLISYELDEVMNVSDTIGVIYDGKIVKTFLHGEADSKEIGLLMAGGDKNANVN